MPSVEFKEKADAYWEDVGNEGKKVWEEVKDANDGIDWYCLYINDIEEKEVSDYE